MPRVYNLKLDKRFKGGAKQWDSFNHLVLNLFMNEHLAIISDTVLSLHEAIQTSLETIEPIVDEEVEFRTPTKRKCGSARDFAALQDDVSEDSEMSDVGDSETADEKRERKKRSAAKTKRNEARQAKRVAQDTAAALTEDLLRVPLKPSMLSDPAYEPYWRQACAKAMGL